MNQAIRVFRDDCLVFVLMQDRTVRVFDMEVWLDYDPHWETHEEELMRSCRSLAEIGEGRPLPKAGTKADFHLSSLTITRDDFFNLLNREFCPEWEPFFADIGTERDSIQLSKCQRH